MPLLFALLAILYCESAYAARAVSFLRSHNFQLSSALSLRSWLGVPELSREGDYQFKAIFAQHPDARAVYEDGKSEDQARIQRRVESSYGKPLDAEAKFGGGFVFRKVEQSVFVNGGAAMMVQDPVIPELSGIVFYDLTLGTAYPVNLPWEIRLKPTLQYGWRRVMDRSFTVGQLLGKELDLKLRNNPYQFYTELNLEAERAFEHVVLGASATSLPVTHHDYAYWKTELTIRSQDLLHGKNLKFPKRLYLWTGFSPVFGGLYTWKRTIRVGTSVAWFSFLRTDLFLFDNFRPAAVLSARWSVVDFELFTMMRSEDEYKRFNSRQYGFSLAARF